MFLIFPAHSRMVLIFARLATGRGPLSRVQLESCEYHSQLEVCWKKGLSFVQFNFVRLASIDEFVCQSTWTTIMLSLKVQSIPAIKHWLLHNDHRRPSVAKHLQPFSWLSNKLSNDYLKQFLISKTRYSRQKGWKLLVDSGPIFTYKNLEWLQHKAAK